MERGQSKIIYVDIDGTICTIDRPYDNVKPIWEHIGKVNRLYDDGNYIVYYTARGMVSKIDYTELTKKQLNEWGCKYHELIMNKKPHYDLYICDKSIRIEEIEQ